MLARLGRRNVGYWVLGTRYWISGIGYWVLDYGASRIEPAYGGSYDIEHGKNLTSAVPA